MKTRSELGFRHNKSYHIAGRVAKPRERYCAVDLGHFLHDWATGSRDTTQYASGSSTSITDTSYLFVDQILEADQDQFETELEVRFAGHGIGGLRFGGVCYPAQHFGEVGVCWSRTAVAAMPPRDAAHLSLVANGSLISCSAKP